MPRLKILLLVAAISVPFVGSRPVIAQDQAAQEQALPTTAPASAPAIVPVAIDTTTPRGALKVLTQAMDVGDTAAVEAVILVDGESEKSWTAAMLKLSVASVTARKAAIQTFGEEGAKAIIGDAAAAGAYAMAAIDRSTEELQGDQATIRSADGVEAPIELRKVGGAWRVPIKVFIGDAPADKLADTAGKMSRQADAIVAFCADMTAGKFKTPEDAAQALQLAQVKAVYGEQSPATAPSPPANPG